MVIAGLGLVALFIALIEDWIVLELPAGRSGMLVPLSRDVADLGNLAAAYLLGTLALLGCLALALFGSAGVRHNVRILGLAMAGGAGGMLLALAAAIDDYGIRILVLDGSNDDADVTAGRGMAMAYVATVAFALALLVAAPHARAVTAERDGEVSGWPWRSPASHGPGTGR